MSLPDEIEAQRLAYVRAAELRIKRASAAKYRAANREKVNAGTREAMRRRRQQHYAAGLRFDGTPYRKA